MGGGAWTTSSYNSYTTATRGMSAADFANASFDTSQVYTTHFLDPMLDPKNVIRECCDSDEHPNTIPVILALDVSGSMGDNISDKSKVRCYEIAMLLGLIANKICENNVFYTFNNDIKKYAISHRNGILETVTNSYCGGGTNMFLPFQKMIDDNIKADRVIILSDNECNSYGGWYSRKPVQSIADEYRKATGNDIWVHAIDLRGYGTQQFHGAKTNIIAGWSEKVFDFIKIAEQGEGTLEKSIEQYIY